MNRVTIEGVGASLPQKVLTNDDLASFIETSDEWITSRTGIKQRYIAEEETTSFMAAEAAKEAFTRSGVKPSQIGLIIVATTTPEKVFPSTACLVQEKLGIEHCVAFDLQAVCAGFVYSLSVASNMMLGSGIEYALVIGSEKMSSILNWQDRTTCVLFGDGAGAVVLKASEQSEGRGFVAHKLQALGRMGHILYADSSSDDKIVMKGGEVFKEGVNRMADTVMSLLAEHKIDLSEVKSIIPHQANSRIIEAVGRKLEVEKYPDLIIANYVHKYANTSAATIPLALYELWDQLRPGDLVVTTALGGGLCWGGNLFYL